MNFNLDIAIFVGFLILNLYVGLSYGKGVKNIKDYALGGQNFSTATLVATIVAIWVSGSGFFTDLTKTYSDGLYYVIPSIGIIFSFIIPALIFIPRMKEFLGSTSVAEGMGNFYGKEVRFIVAIAGLIGCSGSIAVQFKAFSNIFSYFLEFPSTWAVIIAGSIVTIYSAFGGVRSITVTDILQFFTFGFAIPLIGIIIWNQINGSGVDFSVAKTMQDPKFDIKHVLDHNNPRFWEMIALLLYFTIPSMKPAFYQRVSVGKNTFQVKKAFLISAFLVLAIGLITSWIPFLIYTVNPNLQAGQLLGYIIDNYSQPGLKGLLMVGVTAMAMSTADTYINTSSVLFANDIYAPLKLKRSFDELFISKIFSTFLGVFGIFLALRSNDLLDIILTANAFYVPVVTVPLMLTILGFRSSTKAVLIGMAAGFTTMAIWKIIGIKADCIVFSMIVNLIFLVGSHYLLKQPGGWVKIEKEKQNEIINTKPKISVSETLVKFGKNLAGSKIIEFFKKHSPKNELTYMSFGIYCIVYTFATMYSTQAKLFNSDSKTLLYIYQIMLCSSVCMAMYPIWPPKVKHEIIVQVAWNFVLFYMLVFFSGFFVLISEFYPLQFAVFTINIIVVALLSSWRTALIMMIPGFYLSTKFYKYYSGITDGLDVSIGDPQYIMMYILILLGAAFIVFLRPKEYAMVLMEEKNEHLMGRVEDRERALDTAEGLKEEFIRNLTHEFHAPMTGIRSTVETLYEVYDDLPEEARKKAVKNIYNSSVRLEAFEASLVSLSKLANANYDFDVKETDLTDLVLKSLNNCKKLYVEDKDQDKREFVFNVEDKVIAKVDEYYIKQTVDNLIINAINYCSQGKITINLTAKNRYVEFSISDEGVGIPHNELQEIFGAFSISSRTRTPAGGRGVGLAFCKKVIELHDGKIWAEHNKDKGAIFKFILPV